MPTRPGWIVGSERSAGRQAVAAALAVSGDGLSCQAFSAGNRGPTCEEASAPPPPRSCDSIHCLWHAPTNPNPWLPWSHDSPTHPAWRITHGRGRGSPLAHRMLTTCMVGVSSGWAEGTRPRLRSTSVGGSAWVAVGRERSALLGGPFPRGVPPSPQPGGVVAVADDAGVVLQEHGRGVTGELGDLDDRHARAQHPGWQLTAFWVRGR
jgi:hypothetical protein